MENKMHDSRLNSYDDKALTEHEFRMLQWEQNNANTFEPFYVKCIIDTYYTNVVRKDSIYQVVGEEGGCWVLAESRDIPLVQMAKYRFIRWNLDQTLIPGARVRLTEYWDRTPDQKKFPPVGTEGVIYHKATASDDPFYCPLTIEIIYNGSTFLLPVYSCEIERI
jgi:hypothetical protein